MDDSEMELPVVGQGRVHISFRVDIENEILCHEPGISAVIFSYS